MPDANQEFQRDPTTFARLHALLPNEVAAGQHIMSHHKVKHVGNEDLYQIGGAGKISYCNIERQSSAKTLVGDLGFDYTHDLNIFVMQISPNSTTATSFPVYFLPWSQDANFRMQLKPSPKHPLMVNGVVVEPDYFITSALQGCTVVVEGDRQRPVVYHLNASSVASNQCFDRTEKEARATAQAKLLDMNRRYQAFSGAHQKNFQGAVLTPGQANMRNYMPAQISPTAKRALDQSYSNPSMLWNPQASFTNWWWEMSDFEMVQFGTVFGVRRSGDWTFYRQTRNRVEYAFRPTRWNPLGAVQQKKWHAEWVDMKCEQFWP